MRKYICLNEPKQQIRPSEEYLYHYKRELLRMLCRKKILSDQQTASCLDRLEAEYRHAGG